MNLSEIKAISIPEGEVVKIEVGSAVLWEQVEEATYKNWVPFSINADGSVYNGGLGYKNGYRIRSGGAEIASTAHVCYGYIPCKAGDTIRVYHPASSAFSVGTNNVSINVYDSNKTNLGQLASNGLYGVFSGTGEWDKVTINKNILTYKLPTTLPSGSSIAFMRFTNCFSVTVQVNGAGTIITVNEEIE